MRLMFDVCAMLVWVPLGCDAKPEACHGNREGRIIRGLVENRGEDELNQGVSCYRAPI